MTILIVRYSSTTASRRGRNTNSSVRRSLRIVLTMQNTIEIQKQNHHFLRIIWASRSCAADIHRSKS